MFVGGLNEDVDQEELISLFLAKGSIIEYKFVKKFAFFTFDDTGKNAGVFGLSRCKVNFKRFVFEFLKSFLVRTKGKKKRRI